MSATQATPVTETHESAHGMRPIRRPDRTALGRGVVAILLPALCGVVALASLSGRTDNLDRIPAAVVNLDQIVTSGTGDDAQTIAAGRLLAGALTSPEDPEEESLDWELTDADDAEAGLVDGTYQAVLTIPEDFSATIAGLAGSGASPGSGGAAGGTPEAARISVRSNDSSSALVGLLSEQVAQTAATTLGRQLTTTYLAAALGGFAELGVQLGDAADGAAQLAAGVTSVSDGATQLASGTGELSTGLADLATGTADLADGAAELSAGTAQLATGASGLATGLGTLATQTVTMPQDTQALATGAAGVSTGMTQLSTGLAGLAQMCPGTGGAPELCASLNQLAASAGTLQAGAAQVAAGTGTLATQTPALTQGVAGLAAGSTTLSQGVSTLRTGARELATGASQVTDGTAAAADGAQGAADGAAALAAGASELTTGATTLADGLAAGAAQLPASAQDAEELAAVVAEPVVTEATRINESPGGATDPAPLVVALALWLGAFAAYLLLEALPVRALRSPASGLRVALAGWRTAALWALGQATLVGATLPLFGVSLASPVAAVGLTALAALVFAAVNQALVALWGRVGWLVSIALLAVQAAALGGLVPIETAPAFFRALNGALPVPLVVDGLAHLTLGGEVGSLTAVVAALGAWLVAALAVSAVVARSRQQTSVAELRAELAIA
ncbi:YhgE/Pip domain-containing protein [Actinotalea subterranea]|uniref:YhgE/Pip domain-containing protein n=1 Tax=Actinotalea subterranea TaxID=2607497 RepID=UPI0011EFC1B4|nr:YhgE/Pip family protein [Actinotalea subterranea]